MKIGLIARCEIARGLGIQSKNFFDHMPVERVLLVRMPRIDSAERPDWYPGCTEVRYNDYEHTIDETVAREWMDGLDVVFSVETPYHWQLPRWGREMGVKTVIQGNPEFVRHNLAGYEHLAAPDAWWWPTTWRLDKLPAGKVMPVPMPDHEPTGASGGPLRIMHSTGKRAFADRNGTDIFISMLSALRADVHVSAFGLDYCLPEMPRPRGWTLSVEEQGVEDRWTMYDNQHILVLPRRYGGLCLPALEAASRGVAVLMPNCSPNETLASLLIEPRRTRTLNLPAGQVDSYEVNHLDLARDIMQYATTPSAITQAQQQSLQMVTRWSTMRQVYLDEFARVLA